MVQANFSESQLQQSMNTAITMYLYSSSGSMFNAVTNNTVIEYGLGWDTAFYFPWLRSPDDPRQMGCNFFIQYKLSEELGEKGGQYHHWQCPYLRFLIPFKTKDEDTDEYYPDYHQFECLKQLVKNNFQAFYVTNHVIYDYEFLNLATSQQLLMTIPFLNVADIHDYHEKVTFTKTSSYFLLHSEISDVPLSHFKSVVEKTRLSKSTTLLQDIESLERTIFAVEERNNPDKGRIRLYPDVDKLNDISEGKRNIVKVLALGNYLRRNYGTYWYKI